MPLEIETFRSQGWRPGGNFGGTTLFKALGHPYAAQRAHALLENLKQSGPIAVYDPLHQASEFEILYSLADCDITSVFVQNIAEIGEKILGQEGRPVTELLDCKASTLFVTAFDTDRLMDHIRHLIPDGMRILTLDQLRVPNEWLSNPRKYLDPLNFATNFAFFRDSADLHTTVTPDHPALVTDALNARSDLHVLSLLLYVAATGNDYL